MAGHSTFVLFGCLLMIFCTHAKRFEQEPICTSRFDFEEKLLSKMVRLDHAMEILREDVARQLSLEKTTRDEQIKAFSNVIRAEIRAQQDATDQALQKIINRIETPTLKDTIVVFSARQAEASLVDGVPVFKDILVNEGSSYDDDTGKFTCPVPGIYAFTLALRSSKNANPYCYIRLNGSSKQYVITKADHNMASITIYLKLNVGDIVDVGSCNYWDDVDYSGALFSGSLVFKI